MEERRRRLSFRDVTKIVGRLPKDAKEHRRARHLILKQGDCKVTEDELAEVLPLCLYLETLVLSGVPDISDRTMALASKAANLEGLDVTGCTQITDDGVLELMKQPPPMKRLYLNGVTGVTDTAISAIAKKCANLTVLELSGLPLLTAISVRDLWTFSRSLGTLRLSHCSLLTDQAFPSPLCSDSPGNSLSSPRSGRDKPLPPRPTTWVENLPPLILTHTAEHLRVLDLGYCPQLTDESIGGIVAHAPMIETLVLSGCSALSDNAIESICRLGDHLEALGLAHVAKITDAGMMRLARACSKLRCLDVACE
jgi:F-box and leucine-rich repeat protein GRR1